MASFVRATIAGLAFMLVALGVALAIRRLDDGTVIRGLAIPAAASAWLLATPLWRLIVLSSAVDDDTPTARAVVVGFLTGLLAHPLMWLLAYLMTSSSQPLVDAANGVLFYSMYCVIFLGLPTVLVGIALGALLARVRPLTRRE